MAAREGGDDVCPTELDLEPFEIDAATRELLNAPQHVTAMANDEAALRAFISEHALR